MAIAHIYTNKFTILAPLYRQVFDEDFLVRAEVITNFGRLEDANDRRCYQLSQTSLRHRDVPLPKVVENYDDISEEEEEDVKPQVAHKKAKVNNKDGNSKAKKRNKAPKRKRFEDKLRRR